ncbi:MAG TPA: PQQ-binding-like beta-propeller repeat protein, partial [Planctomycetaceae bacterium]|nr:PQQ-binding-like beta-propeller repeat protein [Planctomycetaceae bacterium]
QQYSLVWADPLLLAGNRFELSAYDLGNGQRKWSQNLGGEMGDARAWPLVNFPPVVAGDRLYVRRLTRHGPDVACLETSTGKVLWSRRPGDHAASDPLVFQDDLRVLSVDTPQSGILQVSLTTLDPRTGEVLGQEPLVQLRDVWNRQVPCHAVASDDKIVATLGGSVLCCDLLGNALWLRRQAWAPNQAESHPWFLYRQPPVVAGNRVYVVQPGVMSLDCLDLDSGRLHWQRVLPTVRRIAGIVDGVLVVETNSGFEGLQVDTGDSQWRRDEPRRILTAQLSGEPGGLLYACADPLVGEVSRPRLVWMNPRTGAVTAESLLNLAPFAEKMPMLGPAVVQGDRIWLGLGHNDHDPRREFVELQPAGPALPGSASNPVLEHWTREVSDPLPTQVAETFPGWTLLTRQYDKNFGYKFDFEGERDVFVLQATPQRPVSWARRIDLKESTKRKLAVRVASDPGRVQQLVIRVNDQKVLDTPLDSKAGRWQTFEADLSKFAGDSVWVVATAGPAEAGPNMVGWKRLELVD